MASSQDMSWKLPIRDNELNQKLIREEVYRLNVELAKDELSQNEEVMLKGLKRKRQEEEAITFAQYPSQVCPPSLASIAEEIHYVPVDLKPVYLNKADYNAMLTSKDSKTDLETVTRQIFGYGRNDNNENESIYDVLRCFHSVAKLFANCKLEGVVQTRQEYDKSAEMRRFWREQLKTWEVQEKKAIQKLCKERGDAGSFVIVLTDKEVQRLNRFIVDEHKNSLIVQACDTMKYMLDAAVQCCRVRAVEKAFDRLMTEKAQIAKIEAALDDEEDEEEEE